MRCIESLTQAAEVGYVVEQLLVKCVLISALEGICGARRTLQCNSVVQMQCL